jgi:hypothetical protein
MATATLAAADAALQDDYVEPIIRGIKEKKYLLDQIKRDSSKLDQSGRRWVASVHTRRNRGRGSVGTTEGAVLPTAGRQGYEDAFDTVKQHFYGLEITDAAIEGTAGSDSAFVDLLTEESEGLARDFQSDMNRQAWGDGTGTLAVVTGANTVAVVPVDNLQWVEIGDPVRIQDASAGFASLGDRFVGSIDYVAKTISLTDAAGAASAPSGATAAGDLVTISGNYNNEIQGVRKVINKARILHGVPVTVEVFQSRVTPMAGALAGESSFQQLRDSVNRRGFGKVEAFLTTLGVRRRLAGTYTSQKRYNDAQAVEIHGGYTAIYVDETPVMVDEDGQKGEVLALAKDALTWVEQAAPNWLKQKDGSIFTLKNGSAAGTKEATWQAWFKWYCDLASFLPARGGRLTNCEDDDYEGA